MAENLLKRLNTTDQHTARLWDLKKFKLCPGNTSYLPNQVGNIMQWTVGKDLGNVVEWAVFCTALGVGQPS